MIFNHIGVATRAIKMSISIYEKLGFSSGEIVFDPVQNVNICFLKKSGHPDIELIEPVDKKSPVSNILDKIGTTPYHLCYSCDDLDSDISELKKKRFLTVVSPVKAIALDNHRVCFCYHKDFGLIELTGI